MKWPIHRLEDLTEPNRPITYGVVKPGPEDPENGVKFIRGGDIFQGKLAIESLRTITTAVSRSYSRTLLSGGELVVSLVGNPGHVAVVPKSLAGANLARQAGLVALRSEVDANFVKFFLMSPSGRAELFSQMTGSVQVVINLANLRTVRVPLPPLPIQRRIAGILSAYDELIENSQRRIKILESMARALYREWFVHFRFPGHESVPRVPSPLGEIPKGWEVRRLDQMCRSIQDGDWIETKDQGGEDYRLLQISNVGVGEFVETGNFRYVTQETFDRLRCNEIVPDDLLVARMPTPIGRGWLATKMPWKMITAVDVAIIRAETAVLHPLFLVQAWNDDSNLRRIAAQASGTTRLRITRRELAAMEFVMPPVSMQQKFAHVVEPQSEMIEALREQIQNLRRTRDLLLPRLLSGQIDVEALDHA